MKKNYYCMNLKNVTRWQFYLLLLFGVPLNLFAQTIATINPVFATYGTGTIGGDGNHNKASGDVQLLAGGGLGTGNYGNGWMRFDLSVLPTNAAITDVSVFYHVTASANNASNYIKGYSTTASAFNDPLVATGSPLYNLCAANNLPWVTENNNNGDHTVSLGIDGLSYIKTNFVVDPLLALTFASSSSSINQATTIAGYDHSNFTFRPYLIITYVLPTSINENENSLGINIFPNPSNGQFTIHNPQLSVKSVNIYDMIGRKVDIRGFKISGLQSEIQMDLSSINSGIYFLSIETDKGKFVQKILKE